VAIDERGADDMADRECAQARVQAAIDRRVASGAEVGMQVVVVRHGEVVVDAVSGVADPASGQAVAPDTLFFVQLGPHVRGARRRDALVGAWHSLWLPRQDLRLPARRDRAASDGPHLGVVAA